MLQSFKPPSRYETSMAEDVAFAKRQGAEAFQRGLPRVFNPEEFPELMYAWDVGWSKAFGARKKNRR